MPSNEFWEGDPKLVQAYREAQEMRNQQRNQEMWAQGIYNLRAFKNVIDIFGLALNHNKGGKPTEYPDHPLAFTAAEQKAEQERKRKRALQWAEEHQ